eukprot:364521-Chlamydomonas_euryale.AAC.1
MRMWPPSILPGTAPPQRSPPMRVEPALVCTPNCQSAVSPARPVGLRSGSGDRPAAPEGLHPSRALLPSPVKPPRPSA